MIHAFALLLAATPPAPTDAGAKNLELFLRQAAAFEREGRTTAAVITLSASLGLGAIAAVEAGGQQRTVPISLSAAGAIGLAVGGILMLAINSESERVLEEYLEQDRSTELGRTLAVRDAEAKMEEVVESYRRARVYGGIGALLAGAGSGTLAALQLVEDAKNDHSVEVGTFTLTMISAVAIGIAFRSLAGFEYPVEHTWKLYRAQSEEVTLTVAPVLIEHGGGLTLAGTF